MKMKKMIYNNKIPVGKIKVLHKGVYKGYPFVILAHGGAWPTAYVGVPKSHRYYGLSYDDIDIDCHGGLTYAHDSVYDVNTSNTWWFGWDYAHAGDHTTFTIDSDSKKWTTEEIYDDVKHVILQLRSKSYRWKRDSFAISSVLAMSLCISLNAYFYKQSDFIGQAIMIILFWTIWLFTMEFRPWIMKA